MESKCSSPSSSTDSDIQPSINDNEQAPPSRKVCKQQASTMSEDVPQGMVQSISSGNVQISIGNGVEQGTNGNRQLENMPATNDLMVQLGGNKDVETCQTMNISKNRTEVNGHQYNISGPVTFRQNSEQHHPEPTGIRDVSASEVAEAGIPPAAYNGMVFQVSDELSGKQFKYMKRLLRSDKTNKLGIPKDVINSVKDAEELLDLMEKFDYLGSTNTWFLQYLLYFVGNKSLYKKVFMFTKDSLTSSSALYVCEPSKIKGPKQSNVKLKIVGDIHQFRPIDVETFRQMLAKQCGEDIEYVCTNGLQEGSIILYFQVPEECKKHLLASRELLAWCRMYGITQICVDEEDMVSLPQLTKDACNNYAAQSDAVLDVLRNCTPKDYTSAIRNELKIGGKPLLHLAVELNYFDLVQHLISLGANVADTDQLEATALHLAVFLGHTEICRELLKHNATNVNAVDQFGNTALHIAAYQEDFKLGTLLIDCDASTDVINQEGQSPISIAETNNCAPLILSMTDKKVEDLAVTVDMHIFFCPICHDLFKEPRVLPACAHNFCENCLKRHWQSKGKPDRIECSMCKIVSTVPDGDITGFMLNKPLLKQVEEARHVLKLKKQNTLQAKQVSDDEPTSGVEMNEKQSKTEGEICNNTFSDIVDEENKSEQMDATTEERHGGEATTVAKSDLGEMKKTSGTASSMESSTFEAIENNHRIIVPQLMIVTKKSLTCPCCQKRFRRPVRKLNCSHSFCKTCLKEMAAPGEKHIACHVCNEETDFTNVEDIGLRDLHLDNLVEDADKFDELDQTDVDFSDLTIDDEGADWSDCGEEEMVESQNTDQMEEKLNEGNLTKLQGFGEPVSNMKQAEVANMCRGSSMQDTSTASATKDMGASNQHQLPETEPRLPEYYEMLVCGYYRQQKVFEAPVLNDKGCLLFHKQPKNHPEEDLSQLTLIEFPEITEQSGRSDKNAQYTSQVIGVMQKGVVIHERDSIIYATRRCRSKAFVSSLNIKEDCEIELQRDEETVIFDPSLFEKHLRRWLSGHGSYPEPPNIVITFAQRWNRCSADSLGSCLVYAVVTPMRACTQLARSPKPGHNRHELLEDIHIPDISDEELEVWHGHGTNKMSGLSYPNRNPPSSSAYGPPQHQAGTRTAPLSITCRHPKCDRPAAPPKYILCEECIQIAELYKPATRSGEKQGTQIQHTQERCFSVEDKPSKLYEYQLEVALPAIEGRNTLIQMPTGAGKTVVAACIIEKLINEANEPLKCKVIFMVPTGPLVKQQQEIMEQRLRPTHNFRITGLKGDTQKVPLKETLKVHNVVVLTAAILDNALREGDHLVELDTFALFVFDECHHCMKDHVYNSIMKRYMFEMFEYPDTCKLPQIIGLTATTGTRKAKSQVAAEDHVFQLLCNLNTPHISVVEQHNNILEERVNVPEEMIPICVDPRAEDPFKIEVCKIMSDIEDIMKQCEAGSLLRELKAIPRDRKTQGYMQWLSRLEKESGKEVGDGDQLCIIRTCVRHLHDYHVSLLINAEVRTKDAYDYLNSKYNEMSEPDQMEAFNDTDFNLLRKFMSKRRTFVEVSRNPKYHNPLLKTLEEIIVREYKQRTKSRALLFCQSVETTKALKTWIEETASLQFLQPNRMVGGKGMTSAQHKEILNKFQDGRHKLLVATNVLEEGIDVAECNLVIRLNCVPSDTGHVQSKGRGRAKGSKCYLIASSECNFAAWELANQARSEMSQRAVDGLRRMPIEKLKMRMLARQREDYFQYKMEKQAAQSVRPIHAGEFQLLCGGCRRFACSTIDIGVYNESLHIVLDERFLVERTKVTPHPQPKRIDHEFSTIGKIHCKECNKDWGILAIICQQTLPMIKIVSFIIEREEENGRISRYLKEKWIDAKKIFHVSPLKREDLQGLKKMNVPEY